MLSPVSACSRWKRPSAASPKFTLKFGPKGVIGCARISAFKHTRHIYQHSKDGVVRPVRVRVLHFRIASFHAHQKTLRLTHSFGPAKGHQVQSSTTLPNDADLS
eukprot:1025336-Pelagomonas_calceolata.AAC.5